MFLQSSFNYKSSRPRSKKESPHMQQVTLPSEFQSNESESVTVYSKKEPESQTQSIQTSQGVLQSAVASQMDVQESSSDYQDSDVVMQEEPTAITDIISDQEMVECQTESSSKEKSTYADYGQNRLVEKQIQSPKQQQRLERRPICESSLPFWKALPNLLNDYRRTIIKLLLTITVAYYSTVILSSIGHDILAKQETEKLIHETKTNKCREDYIKNRCEPYERVEALQDYCESKELCMNAPLEAGIKGTRVVLALIAENLNDFSERLTYRSLVLLVLMIYSFLTLMKYTKDTPKQNIELVLQQESSPSKSDLGTSPVRQLISPK